MSGLGFVSHVAVAEAKGKIIWEQRRVERAAIAVGEMLDRSDGMAVSGLRLGLGLED